MIDTTNILGANGTANTIGLTPGECRLWRLRRLFALPSWVANEFATSANFLFAFCQEWIRVELTTQRSNRHE